MEGWVYRWVGGSEMRGRPAADPELMEGSGWGARGEEAGSRGLWDTEMSARG